MYSEMTELLEDKVDQMEESVQLTRATFPTSTALPRMEMEIRYLRQMQEIILKIEDLYPPGDSCEVDMQ